jgi:ABC-type multidrug transport system fused ATPase/permease subunit
MALFTLLSKLTAQENIAHATYSGASSTLKTYEMFTEFVNTHHIDDESKGIGAPPDWPSCGQIEFRNIVYRYGPHMPIALQIENLKIETGWKAGIVRPPGAGKSTLLNLLFRLFPLKGVAPKSGGVVTIDGVDIATLKLDTLRSAIGVVPQEPVRDAQPNSHCMPCMAG